MKKILLLFTLIVTISLSCISCTTSAYATNDVYRYSVNDDVVVVGDTCYVYYTNPSTTFLNTLHVIDGAYFYWHLGRYIHVVFPYWETWSPYRYFYYSNGIWSWRWRNGFNHIHHDNYRYYNHYNAYKYRRDYIRYHSHVPKIDYRYKPSINHGGNHNINHRPSTITRSQPSRNHSRPSGTRGHNWRH